MLPELGQFALILALLLAGDAGVLWHRGPHAGPGSLDRRRDAGGGGPERHGRARGGLSRRLIRQQ